MSDNINIHLFQAGAANVGGKGNSVGPGTVNVYADPAGQITQLRGLLDDLVRLAGQHGVPPQVQATATEAVAEAANPTPDTGRLRTLMNKVLAVVGNVGPVAKVALNVITVVSGIENIIR